MIKIVGEITAPMKIIVGRDIETGKEMWSIDNVTWYEAPMLKSTVAPQMINKSAINSTREYIERGGDDEIFGEEDK